MSAVSPSRVGKTFDDAALREIVDTISNTVYLLEIEIVIFNVEVRQQFFMSLRSCPQLSQGAEGWHSQGMCYWTVERYLC